MRRIKCALDEDGCIDLLAVLQIMNQIDQEQAWALAYELAALMQRLAPASNCAVIESLGQIHIHSDGFIHDKSIAIIRRSTGTPASRSDDDEDQETDCGRPAACQLGAGRRQALDEAELVASLGIALFWALDYGIPDDEERKLSIAMEYLIVQTQSEFNLKELTNMCIKRLPIATKSHADLHYRSVCKTLISDTIELSTFLDKIHTASMVLSDISGDISSHLSHDFGPATGHKLGKAGQLVAADCDIVADVDHHFGELGEPLASLRALRINDWARLWMQVIRELRQRGRVPIQ